MSTAIGLVSRAVGLGGGHNILRRVGVLVVRAAVGGSSPLLDDILQLILHGADIVLSFHGLVDDAFIDRDLGIYTLAMRDLNSSLLRSSIGGSFSQLLYEASRRARARFG
jgi:hypothetical protein